VVGCGGSPLSGANRWSGYCAACKTIVSGQKASDFSALWTPINELIKEYPNQDIIRPGKKAKFSWSTGTIGEDTPDEVIKPKVQGLDLADLVQRIQAL
jgi:hypothetical protein